MAFFIHTLTGYAFLIYLLFAAVVAPFVLLTAGLAARPQAANKGAANALPSKTLLVSGAILLAWEFLYLVGFGTNLIGEMAVNILLMLGPVLIVAGAARAKLALPKSTSVILVIGGAALVYFLTLPTVVWGIMRYN